MKCHLFGNYDVDCAKRFAKYPNPCLVRKSLHSLRLRSDVANTVQIETTLRTMAIGLDDGSYKCWALIDTNCELSVEELSGATFVAKKYSYCFDRWLFTSKGTYPAAKAGGFVPWTTMCSWTIRPHWLFDYDHWKLSTHYGELFVNDTQIGDKVGGSQINKDRSIFIAPCVIDTLKKMYGFTESGPPTALLNLQSVSGTKRRRINIMLCWEGGLEDRIYIYY